MCRCSNHTAAGSVMDFVLCSVQHMMQWDSWSLFVPLHSADAVGHRAPGTSLCSKFVLLFGVRRWSQSFHPSPFWQSTAGIRCSAYANCHCEWNMRYCNKPAVLNGGVCSSSDGLRLKAFRQKESIAARKTKWKQGKAPNRAFPHTTEICTRLNSWKHN